jgi:hypothetical protein
MEPKKLIEIASMHELRGENGEEIKLEKGVWIEVADFDPITERVEIKKRVEVESVDMSEDREKEYYTIRCKRLDFKKYDEDKKALIEEIISKYHERLKASFAKCMVEGVEGQSIQKLRQILYKLKGKVDDEI